MELEVKREFKDKNTGKTYKEKELIKVSKERGEELLKSPYDLVKVKTTNKKEEKKDVQAKTDKESKNNM